MAVLHTGFASYSSQDAKRNYHASKWDTISNYEEDIGYSAHNLSRKE